MNYMFDKSTRLKQVCQLLLSLIVVLKMSGLQPRIFLVKGAHVMLTMNLWTEAGLCNDATGIVEDFIYANNQEPPDLPVAVIVKFDSFTLVQQKKL